MALTEREKAILQLKAEGVSDYRIARKLKMEIPNVTRSRKNALKKIERARADLEFVDRLKSGSSSRQVFKK
ncbi:MAG: LuxR C-terminal-related transcriptional regulator [Candidatus Bathyarchaeia archaeon]|jgi:transcriptional regulator